MSSSNYLKPDLLDVTRLSSTATSEITTLSNAVTAAATLNALATLAVATRTAHNGVDVEIALTSLQTAADALARLHL